MSTSTITADTLLIPEILAAIVVREAGPLIENVHAPAEAVARLAARAERHYAGDGGPQFAKRVRSKHGLEHLRAFMRHSLATELIEGGMSRCQLPFEWGIGGTRPLDLNNQLKD